MESSGSTTGRGPGRTRLPSALAWMGRGRRTSAAIEAPEPEPAPQRPPEAAGAVLPEVTRPGEFAARLDARGDFIDAPASYASLGWDPQTLVGRSIYDLIHPEDAAIVGQTHRQLLEAQGPLWLRFRLRAADGACVWADAVASIHPGREGERQLHLYARDATAHVRDEAAARHGQIRYRALIDNLRQVVFATDAAGRWTFLAGGWQEITGYPVPASLGRASAAFVHPEDRARHLAALRDLDNDGTSTYRAVLRLRTRERETRWVEVVARVQRDTDGRITGASGTLDDVTETMSARSERDRLADVVEVTSDLVATMAPDGSLRWMNRAARAALAVGPDQDLADLTVADLHAPTARPTLFDEVVPALVAQGIWRGETMLLARDGREVPISQVVIGHRGANGRIDHFSMIGRDISDRLGLEAQLAHLSMHDAVTGLANRALLLDRLEHALARGRRQTAHTAVLFADLDHFKTVNDALGRGVGDRLLNRVAERLRAVIRPDDTAARFGGDQFVVLCSELDREETAIRLADRICAAIAEPFEIDDHTVRLTASVGIALPTARQDAATLLRDADAAMHRAKEFRRGGHFVFDEVLRREIRARLEDQDGMRRAAERDELTLRYQPVVDLATGAVVGMQASPWWTHPARGLLPPADFLAAAEESDAILPIATWALRQACRQAGLWHAEFARATGSITVAASPRQLASADFLTSLDAALADAALPAGRLSVLIAERSLGDDRASTVATLLALRARGVRLVVQDFGVGRASLSDLRHVRVDGIRAHESFVRGVAQATADAAVAAGLATMAAALGIQLTAEGVETAEQAAVLRRLGYRHAQGPLFCDPLTPERAAAMWHDGGDWDPRDWGAEVASDV